jgi:K+-transporting ATPase ATPase A chain
VDISSALQYGLLLSIVAALTNTFGRMTGRVRQGWLLFGVMAVLFTGGLVFCDMAERQVNPQIAVAHLTGGNMEGKETRFGIGSTVLTAITTSNGATGSYNAMHDSFNPLGGMIPLINMLLGEIIFGGLGTGLYSIVMVALIGLFIAGLMIGRTPVFLGKVIGIREVKFIMLYTLASPAAILMLTAIAVVTKASLEGLTTNTGAHGFTAILCAYASANANNGQSFAGLSANTPFYNITTAITMMVGRFGLATPAPALAGLLSRQQRRPGTAGTLLTETFLFASVVAGSALPVGGLSYLPALALGPVMEHLQMFRGHERETSGAFDFVLEEGYTIRAERLPFSADYPALHDNACTPAARRFSR